MLKVGDKLPSGSLQEFIEVEGNGCSLGPNSFDVEKTTAGKKIAIFALPGAYTPTCSAKHVPGYVENAAALKAAGVDEIWCISVNDAFVMGAWGRDQKSQGAVRMMADGSADFTKATGLTLDLTTRGMGLRSIPCWWSMAWSSRSMSKDRANSRSAMRAPCWRRPGKSWADRCDWLGVEHGPGRLRARPDGTPGRLRLGGLR
jgi:peroxiredoxin